MLAAVLERLEKIVGRNIAEHVDPDPARLDRQDRRGGRDLRREVGREISPAPPEPLEIGRAIDIRAYRQLPTAQG